MHISWNIDMLTSVYCDNEASLTLNLLLITQPLQHAFPPWFTLTAPLLSLGQLGLSVRRAATLWTWVV